MVNFVCGNAKVWLGKELWFAVAVCRLAHNGQCFVVSSLGQKPSGRLGNQQHSHSRRYQTGYGTQYNEESPGTTVAIVVFSITGVAVATQCQPRNDWHQEGPSGPKEFNIQQAATSIRRWHKLTQNIKGNDQSTHAKADHEPRQQERNVGLAHGRQQSKHGNDSRRYTKHGFASKFVAQGTQNQGPHHGTGKDDRNNGVHLVAFQLPFDLENGAQKAEQ